MPTLFTRIIQGELPARFVWQDEHCVAFLTINPLRPGHTLVVPRLEVDHWLDLSPELAAHLADVSRKIGVALQRAYEPPKVALIIAGLEVPHVHYHVTPIWNLRDTDFAQADPEPRDEDQDRAAETLRAQLRELGHDEVTD